jgi:hypothetical protein
VWIAGVGGDGGDGGCMRIGFKESGERGGTWVWTWDREWENRRRAEWEEFGPECKHGS